MKHDPNHAPAVGTSALDRQVSALAARLRDEGVAPDHDLWPDISRALDAAGAPGRAIGRRTAARNGSLWAAAALAACVIVAVGAGLTGVRPGSEPVARLPEAPTAGGTAANSETALAPMSGPVATRQGLRAVEAALDELQAALAQAPDDPDLSRLVLMIHHSRGRLLRLQADGGTRNALGGRT
ncbi:MAG: hypothetical protein IPO18_10730 [bacterium]|nr:hypothetical protein [bacterium]